MSEMEERVAAAIILAWYPDAPRQPPDGRVIVPPKIWDEAHILARAVSGMLRADPDIQELLRWLDFKSVGWNPEEQTYIGARKLLELFAVKPVEDAAEEFTTGETLRLKKRVAANPDDFKGIYGSKGT